MTEVAIEGVTKRFAGQVAVEGVSLQVGQGEFVALLGPSGCGKTTTLRMVAGFTRPDTGTIRLRGRDVTRVPPHQRDCGMVFQGYALFPHLTVAENIAFGLRRRRVGRADTAVRVARMIEALRLQGLEDRRPAQLSGGQQQRVAVARALAIEPAVLLMDEPFSALDAHLREATRAEMRALQRRLGITAIFVTHDQAEALSLSDRVAVMNAGRIEQVGTPREVYERPRTRFTAGFIGHANLLPGGLLRPERIMVSSSGVPGVVEDVAYLGPQTEIVVRVQQDGLPDRLLALVPAADAPSVGAAVHLSWPQDAVVLLEA